MTTGQQKRYFEFQDDKSAKFWEVTTDGTTVTVRYGKIGTNGQSQTKELADAAAAAKHVAKLVAEKTGKGYEESGVNATAQAASETTSAVPPTAAPCKKAATAKKAAVTNPAKDPDASPASLLALLNKDDTTNRLLARHPRASADLLEKLSHSSDKATRQGVAANPNTPPETYVKLGQQFPKEFLANPALDLLLMLNPALMEEVPEALLVRLLKQTDCPPSLLTWAAGTSNSKVQLAVAMNANAPESARQRLGKSFDPAVREAVKPMAEAGPEQEPEQAFVQALRERIGSLSRYELEEAWKSGDIGLAQWSALPLTFRLAQVTNSEMFAPACVARLLRDSGKTLAEIRALLPRYMSWDEVAKHPFTPVGVLEALAKDSNDSILHEVAANPSTPEPMKVRLLEALHIRKFTLDLYKVARNPATPAPVLEKLSKRSDNRLRCVVAENPATPVPVLENLSRSADEFVRRAVAENPSVPVSVLEILSKDSKYTVRSAVAQNPSVPVSVLEALARDADVDVRRAVASNPLTPAPLLNSLSKDPDTRVRWYVIDNRSAPVSVLEALVGDAYGEVRRAVARNPITPALLLDVLSKDPDSSVRQEVIGNPSAPVSVLEALAGDSEGNVRRAVAGNTRTDPTVLEKLTTDRDSYVKETAIRNPNTPLPALLKHISAQAVGVRWALATQSHRSPEILHHLWKDIHDHVRKAVASCPGLTQAELDEMLQSCELETDLATLLVHPNLGVKGVECIFDQLFTTPAADSAWYRRKLAEASTEIRAAAQSDKVTFYHGKDPNKAVLAKRALAPLMALCAGPFIEPDRLVKVVGSTDWLVRAAVARNPGTPPNLIKKLSADAHPLVAALAKRALVPIPEVSTTSDKLDAEDLDLERAVAEVINRIRQDATNKPMTLMGVVSDDAWGDQADVVDVLNALSAIGKIDRVLPQVCSKLGQEYQALMWEMGAKSTDPKVRQALAESPLCPVDVITRLAEDDNPDVVLAALKNPVMPPENRAPIVRGLLKLRGSRLAKVACNPNAPPELLEAMAKSRDEGIRSYAAGNRSTPESVLLALSKDPDLEVRLGVALNPSTPVPALEALSKAANHEVKQHVAANRSTPASVKVRVLEALSRSAKAEFRISTAQNPFTPPPVLEDLSKDSESSVRRAVAKNPSAPVSLLEIFSEDIDIRDWVVTNPATPGPALEALSKNSEWHIRKKVAGNPSTPPYVLEALSKLQRVRIQEYFSIPGGVRGEFSVADSSIQRAVAANPSTPLTVLDTLSRDSDDQVRLAVAGNPSTSKAALSCLALDSDGQVAVSAAFNPSASSAVREQHIEGWVNRMERAVQREACIRADKLPMQKTPISTEDLLRALGWLGYFSPGDDNKALTKASRSKDWLVRLGAALHPDATEGILKLLRQDADPSVARAAQFRQLKAV